MKKGNQRIMNEEEIQELGRRIQEVDERRMNRKIFCYQCKGDTKQDILFEKVELIYPKELIFLTIMVKEKIVCGQLKPTFGK
ncbi:MAG: hypothetical protein RL308_96 [Bacteroidota bacterium]|jgi:hypothetical protein